MIYTVEMEEPADDTPCGGCGCWTGTFADVEPIGDCSLTPGDDSPAGRCPNCDGLVYVITPKTLAQDNAGELLAALTVAAQEMGVTGAPPEGQRQGPVADQMRKAIAAATPGG